MKQAAEIGVDEALVAHLENVLGEAKKARGGGDNITAAFKANEVSTSLKGAVEEAVAKNKAEAERLISKVKGDIESAKRAGVTDDDLKAARVKALEAETKLVNREFTDAQKTASESIGLVAIARGVKTLIPPDMVRIPEGDFTMGSDDGSGDEKPVNRVRMDSFMVDVKEVTNANFKKFVDSAGYRPSGWSYDSGKANHPAVNVTWHDAAAYCKWAGKRLPTEAEWEYAAGGPEHFKWSLGNEFDGSKYTWDRNRGNPTREVGSHPPNGFGLYDMSGNVWEWVSSLYKPYPYRADDGRENLNASGTRVLRGGSWYGSVGGLRAAGRDYFGPSFRDDGVGFRCSRS